MTTLSDIRAALSRLRRQGDMPAKIYLTEADAASVAAELAPDLRYDARGQVDSIEGVPVYHPRDISWVMAAAGGQVQL